MRRNTFLRFIPIILFIVIMIALESCSPMGSTENPVLSKCSQFVNPGIAIWFPKRELHLKNGNDVTMNLGQGDSADVFYQFFYEQFSKELFHRTNFKKVVPSFLYDVFYDKNFSLHTFVDGKEKEMKIYLPLNQTPMDAKSDSVQFTLFINSFKIWRISGRSKNTKHHADLGRDLEQSVGDSSGDRLAYTLSYSLMYNETNETVFSGKFGKFNDIPAEKNKLIWESLVTSIVKEIFAKTPFYKKEA